MTSESESGKEQYPGTSGISSLRSGSVRPAVRSAPQAARPNSTGSGIYRKVLAVVLAEGKLSDVSDIVDEAKRRLLAARIPYAREPFNAAVSALLPRFPLPVQASPAVRSTRPSAAPLTRSECAVILARLNAAGLIRPVERQAEPRR